MQQQGSPPAFTDFDAVLFDLDGVLTATAKIHAACWKRMFDAYLQRRAAERGEPFVPFDVAADYLRYVDGRLRYEGVRNFLESRGIVLPWGEPADPPQAETVCGLGNQKDAMVSLVLAEQGVEVYPGSVTLARQLRQQGVKTAVVSASKNCEAILRGAGIVELFALWVDGKVAERLGLPGKPSPATFLEAARQLGVAPQRSVVIEDALSGVQAARAGGFGWVVGVARHGDAAELLAHGADIVVNDLSELL